MPRLPHVVVHAGIDDVRVGGIEDDIAGAGRVVDEEDARPRRTGIHGAIDAAFLIRAEGVAHRGGEDDPRIGRADRNPCEPFAALEAEMLPRMASVTRLVQSVAEGNAVARKAL